MGFMDITNKLANNLKKIRIERKISQEKLSAKADISPRYYQSIEAGKSMPSIIILMKIALALKIEYTDILNPIWKEFIDQNKT